MFLIHGYGCVCPIAGIVRLFDREAGRLADWRAGTIGFSFSNESVTAQVALWPAQVGSANQVCG